MLLRVGKCQCLQPFRSLYFLLLILCFLLFLQTLYAPITPFVKRLRNFQKVDLKKSEKKTVTFLLTDEDFTYVDVHYKTVKLPGKYNIMIQDLELEIDV